MQNIYTITLKKNITYFNEDNEDKSIIYSKQVFIDILYTSWIRLAPHATHTQTHTHTLSYYLQCMNIFIYQLSKPLLKY